jgi:two-component system cell cycle sensor histidine kinase/response regulator CckA
MASTHVLVVEDEGVVARNIQLELNSLGYVVPAIASSGTEALEKAEALHPDLVLMDIVLKGEMDGIEAGKQIRKKHDVPVVYLTAYADDETLQRATATEPYGYLIKPYEERELHSTIQLALSKHKTERMWKEAHHWLTSIIQCIDDAVIVADARGCISMVNRSAECLTGLARAEAIGKELLDVCQLIHQDRRCPLGIPTIQALREGHAARFEERSLLLGKGREIPVDGWVAAIHDSSEALSGFVVVFRERARWQRQQRGWVGGRSPFQQEQKTDSPGLETSGLAHDFSRLLTCILGSISSVASRLPQEAPERKCLVAVEQAAAWAGEIIQRSMDLFTPPSPHLEPLDLNKVVGEVVDTLSCLFSPRLAIEFSSAPQLWSVQGDALLLHEVVLDLCLNARDVMPYGGRLVLETENVGMEEDSGGTSAPGNVEGFVRLRVREAGSEMPAVIRSRLFEPSFTADESSKGTSSGLAFVFGVVGLHGGWIDCSGEVDQDTCFEIYLPRSGPKRSTPLVVATTQVMSKDA